MTDKSNECGNKKAARNAIEKYAETATSQAKLKALHGIWRTQKKGENVSVCFTKDERQTHVYTFRARKYLFSGGGGGIGIRHGCVVKGKQRKLLWLVLLHLSRFRSVARPLCHVSIYTRQTWQTISMFRMEIYLHEWLTLTVERTCCMHTYMYCIANGSEYFVTWITWNWCQLKSYKLFKQFASEFNLFNLRISFGLGRKCVISFRRICVCVPGIPEQICTGHIFSARVWPLACSENSRVVCFLVDTLLRISFNFFTSLSVLCFCECLHFGRCIALRCVAFAKKSPLEYILSSYFIFLHYHIWR